MLSPDYILNILKTHCGYNNGDSILVGVSGGADSVALLHLIHAAGIPCAAAHVNYGLRGEESDGDEKFVSELCAELNVALYTRRTNHDELDHIDNNLQAAARKSRFKFFEEIVVKESMTWIALAHHNDDQLETILMNLMRGSGLNGLTGIKYRSGSVVRPLLNTSHESICEYLRILDQACRWDSTNSSNLYWRNRIRHNVVPYLKENDQREGKGWQHTIEQLNESSDLLDELMSKWAAEATVSGPRSTQIFEKALNLFPKPHALLNYILKKRGVKIKFTPSSYEKFVGQQTGTELTDEDSTLLRDRDCFILFLRETPAEEKSFSFGNPPEGWSCTLIENFVPTQFTRNEALVNQRVLISTLLVRPWKAGDRIFPLGMKGSRKVSDVLTEMKIPLNEKQNYPVLVCNDEIIWIPGYRIAEKYKVTPETKTALHIKWNR